jgi:small subunit ribosomal protein S13
LARIKGVSWSLSNAICYALKLDKERKIKSLSEEEIEKISKFIRNPQVPEWLLNRKKDPATGLSKHLVTTDLEMQKEFDIRKMKKIRTYKGWRHAIGQPVRGQRTRSHFRKGVSVGVIKKKQAPAKSEKGAKEEKKK